MSVSQSVTLSVRRNVKGRLEELESAMHSAEKQTGKWGGSGIREGGGDEGITTRRTATVPRWLPFISCY